MKKIFAVILSLGLILAPMPAINTARAGESGGGGYAQTILGMANGIIGTAILLKCKLGTTQISLTLYFAGSLIYAAAEIMGGKDKKKSTNENAASLDALKANMVQGGDYQRAAVEAQLKNERDNLKHIQKKRKFMMATKVVYMSAAAMAALEALWATPGPWYKPDIGGCTGGGFEHKGVEMAVVLAYTAAQGYAGGGLMGAGMAAAATYVTQYTSLLNIGTFTQDLLTPLLNPGMGRFLIFTAAAALVVMIDKDLSTREKETKQKIADLEKILGTFSASDNAIAEGDTGTVPADPTKEVDPASNPDLTKSGSIKALAVGAELDKTCFTKATTGIEANSKACSNPLKVPGAKFDGKVKLPSALVSVTQNATDMAQAAASGDMDKAELEAGKINAMAAKVDAIHGELMKKVNDKLKAEGKKPLDVKGELDRQLAAFNNQVAKQNPSLGKAAFGDMGSVGSATVSDTKSGKAQEGSTSDTKAASDSASSAAPIDLSKIGSDDLANQNPYEDGKVASLSDSLEEFETAENDISKDPDVSIFKQVSNRYLLNYTKIFQRKEIKPPLAPQPQLSK